MGFRGKPHVVSQPNWLIVPPALDFPTLVTRCPRAYRRVLHSSCGSWNLWTGIRTDKFCLDVADFHGTCRDLLHAANLATWDPRLYFPSEGRRAEDFSAIKIQQLRPGLNPRTWVPEASTLTPRPLLDNNFTCADILVKPL
jgi:hypothetical protein